VAIVRRASAGCTTPDRLDTVDYSACAGENARTQTSLFSRSVEHTSQRPREQRAGKSLAPHVASLLALQRTAGNRAAAAVARRQLQRAIVAIDGPGEATKGEGRATRACLWNLQYNKGGRSFAGGDARGKVEGPKEIGSIAVGANLLARESEDLYILGHGSADLTTVAGLKATDLAARIRRWLAPMVASGKVFIGDIKLVACLSAAESSDWSGGKVKPYAQALAEALAPIHPDDPIRPQTVTGIVGIGWVDETTGRQLSVDFRRFQAGPMGWEADPTKARPGVTLNPFQAISDPVARGQALQAWFQAPVLVPVAGGPAPTGPFTFYGKGPSGKRKFEVETGTEIAPRDYTQPRLVMDVSQHPYY
jgi:hypothetical protein